MVMVPAAAAALTTLEALDLLFTFQSINCYQLFQKRGIVTFNIPLHTLYDISDTTL